MNEAQESVDKETMDKEFEEETEHNENHND